MICDLYQEEDIPLTLSVDDFKNVAEKVQSYSKDFSLPATKRNNQIFDNIFEVTRTTTSITFNPYVKTKCVLKEDGLILFEGYLRLIDIKQQKSEISYNVNLYSEVVALADVLKERTFNYLSFNELQHQYNKTNIKNSWNTAGTGISYTLSSSSGYRDANDTLKYPFVNWVGDYPRNIGNDFIQAGDLSDMFRPFIQIKYLINRIFQATPFTWTSEFFDTTDFGKLYMDFNWGAGNQPGLMDATQYNGLYFEEDGTNYATTSYTTLQMSDFPQLFGYYLPPEYDHTTHTITATQDNQNYYIDYSYTVENTHAITTNDVECRWLVNSTQLQHSGIVSIPNSSAVNNTWTYAGNLVVTLNTGDTLKAQFKASATTTIKQYYGGTVFTMGGFLNIQVGASLMTNGALLNNLRGETNQWDFLKGIMTMFNLVSLPDNGNPNNILIEPYGNIFINNANSVQHDWTDKVDVSQMQMTPLTDLNKKTIFKFEEDDDDYNFKIYKNSTQGHLYGSKVFSASAFTILDGVDEIVAEPFAATVSRPIIEEYSDFVIPQVYTSNDEQTEFEGFDNAPRIMYDMGKHTLQGGVEYYIPAQNGLSSEWQDEFLQFSHLTDIPTLSNTTRDFHFGECQLINPIGFPPTKNLFNLYWLPYYGELYNADTRIMTVKVNLSPSDINMFKFYDTVFIKNRVYRVNNINYKPNDLALVEFILIP